MAEISGSFSDYISPSSHLKKKCIKTTETSAVIINHIVICYIDCILPKDSEYIDDCNHSYTTVDLGTTVLLVVA